MAGAGVGIQFYYDLPFVQVTPFIVGYGFLFAAAELCALIGAKRPRADARFKCCASASSPGMRDGPPCSSTAAYGLPDVASLYIAFTLLWTVATAVIAWSEFCKISAAEAAPAPLTPPRRAENGSRTPSEPLALKGASCAQVSLLHLAPAWSR